MWFYRATTATSIAPETDWKHAMRLRKLLATSLVATTLVGINVPASHSAQFFTEAQWQGFLTLDTKGDSVEDLAVWWGYGTYNDSISSIRSYNENYRVCEHAGYQGACLVTNKRDFNNLRGVREGLQWWDPFDWNDRISSLQRL